MKILKRTAIGLLSLILFISLFLFSVASTVKSTLLNPEFLPDQIDRLPVSTIVKDMTDTDFENLRPEVKSAINQTVTDMEPQLKQAAGAAIVQIYDYLLGKKPNPELAATLRNTVLSNSFIDNLIDETPVATIVSNVLLEELNKQEIPAEMQPLLNYIPSAFSQNEADLKAQLKQSAPLVIQYLIGQSKSYDVTINLQPEVDYLKTSAKQMLTNNPPAALAGVPSALQGAAVDQYIKDNIGVILNEIPATISVDETQVIGQETPVQIAQDLKKAEQQLSDIRSYVHLFQQYYIYLIILIVLLIAGIAAIYHSVRGSTRTLGIIFVIFGAVEMGGVLIGKLIMRTQVFPIADLPVDLSQFLQRFTFSLLSPLQIFSLVVLIIGVGLCVFSFLYRPLKPKTAAEPVKS